MKMIVSGIEGLEQDLDAIGGRENARRIVEAGSKAAIEVLKQRTANSRHVVTGGMMASFAPGQYHEDLDKCWQDVYPQGNDPRGVSQSKKAFVINYGYGSRRTKKTGDKFITGKSKELEEAVSQAMMAEADRIINERKR